MGALSLLILLLNACTSLTRPTQPTSIAHETKKLDRLLRTLPGADPSETRRLAREAVSGSLELRQRYEVTSPPLWHNTLVNLGVKKRGLCWHWADDLYRRLKRLRLRTLKILPVGASIGSYWGEHNALAVLPARSTGFPLGKAVLLDPWRGGGRLFFIRVEADPEYRWSVRWERLGHPAAMPDERTPRPSVF